MNFWKRLSFAIEGTLSIETLNQKIFYLMKLTSDWNFVTSDLPDLFLQVSQAIISWLITLLPDGIEHQNFYSAPTMEKKLTYGL